MIPNRLLLFPVRISEFSSENESRNDVTLFPIQAINRDANHDHTRQININVHNNIHVHLPSSNTDDQTNMIINHNHGSNTDNSDNDTDDDTCVGSSQDTNTSSSSCHSQRSAIFATPPYSSQSKSPPLPSTP